MSLKSKISCLEKELHTKNEKINKYKSKYKHYKHVNQHKWINRVDNDISIKEKELKSSIENTGQNKASKDDYDK